MATDDALRSKLRESLGGLDGVVEKPMPGGIQFVWKGRMLCGVMGEDLMLRIDERRHDAWIAEDGARPLMMAGQTLRGWLLVPKATALASSATFRKWIGRATAFVGTLKEK